MADDEPVEVPWTIHLGGGVTFVILVVDDANDDELVEAIANNRTGKLVEFAGRWKWSLGTQAADFTLSGPFTRTWRLPNMPATQTPLIVSRPHVVVIMPAEIAEGLNTQRDFLQRLAASLPVDMNPGQPTAG